MFAKFVFLMALLVVAMARPQLYSGYGYGDYTGYSSGYPGGYYGYSGYSSPYAYNGYGAPYASSPYGYGYGYGY